MLRYTKGSTREFDAGPLLDGERVGGGLELVGRAQRRDVARHGLARAARGRRGAAIERAMVEVRAAIALARAAGARGA